MSRLEGKTESEKDRKLSWIQRFLCICAGVDKEVLKQCTTEWNKYTGIGATILFTGVLASLSGGYALYTIFRNGDLSATDTSALLPAFLFGILWGLIIFNLDRFIVSTFRKLEVDIWWKKAGKELLQALPRIVLAVIIAIVISKPIEIKIFESRLAGQIKQNEIDAKKQNADDFLNIYQIPVKERRISNLDTTLTKLQTELTTDPQNVKDLINNDLEQAINALTRIRNNNNPKINQHRQNITSIRNNQSNYRPVYDNDGDFVRNDLTKEANDRIRNENNAIGVLNNEITTQQAEVNKINNQIVEARREYKVQKQQEISDKKQEKTEAETFLKESVAKAEEETADANQTSEKAFTNNFITQIEALGDLTDNDSTMWWTSLMITLLFLTIELAPILTKLITNRGSYDETLDRIEYEKMIEQKEIISRRNSEINELLVKAEEAAKLRGEAFLQAQKIKLDAELNNNKIITDKIAEYQQEIALLAIEKWREEEKAKVEATYIKTKPILENIRWRATNLVVDAVFYFFNSSGELDYDENGVLGNGSWKFVKPDREIEIELPGIKETYTLRNFSADSVDLENKGTTIKLSRV